MAKASVFSFSVLHKQQLVGTRPRCSCYKLLHGRHSGEGRYKKELWTITAKEISAFSAVVISVFIRAVLHSPMKTTFCPAFLLSS